MFEAKIKAAALAIIILLFVSCDKDKTYDKSKAISLIAQNNALAIDSELIAKPIKLPAQKQNTSWQNTSWQNTSRQNNSGSSRFCSHLINCETPQNFKKSYKISDEGGFFNKTKKISLQKKSSFTSLYSGASEQNFVYSPVILGDFAYILDSSGELLALALQDFKIRWRKQIFLKKNLKNYRAAKLTSCGDKFFAVAGTNEIVAANRGNGEVLWRKELSSILTSSPICDESSVFVLSDNNKIFSINAENGSLNWFASGMARPTTIFGSSNPVISGNQVIVAYSSGEVSSINKKTGEVLWDQELTVNKATTSDFYLNDIDATPIVVDDVLYVVGNGGLLKAISLKNGEFLWKKEIASVIDFWVAGDFIFIINNDNKLLAINRKNGGIKYVADLPAFAREKNPASKFVYSSVILAGDKLLISRTDGVLIIASPYDGKIEKQFNIGGRLFSSPAIVNDKIYLLSIGRYAIEFSEYQ